MDYPPCRVRTSLVVFHNDIMSGAGNEEPMDTVSPLSNLIRPMADMIIVLLIGLLPLTMSHRVLVRLGGFFASIFGHVSQLRGRKSPVSEKVFISLSRISPYSPCFNLDDLSHMKVELIRLDS